MINLTYYNLLNVHVARIMANKQTKTNWFCAQTRLPTYHNSIARYNITHVHNIQVGSDYRFTRKNNVVMFREQAK